MTMRAKNSPSQFHTGSWGRSTRPIRLSDDNRHLPSLQPVHTKKKPFQCEMGYRLFRAKRIFFSDASPALNPAWRRRRFRSIRPYSHGRRNKLWFSIQEVQDENKMHPICHTREEPTESFPARSKELRLDARASKAWGLAGVSRGSAAGSRRPRRGVGEEPLSLPSSPSRVYLGRQMWIGRPSAARGGR
jgi:hypothetical protein